MAAYFSLFMLIFVEHAIHITKHTNIDGNKQPMDYDCQLAFGGIFRVGDCSEKFFRGGG